MKFRPCIDVHNGKVKQIIGGSLRDSGDQAHDNFVSDRDGAWYGSLYRSLGLKGGHAIILNPASSEYYEADRQQVFGALSAFPGGLMVGGGVNADNAADYIRSGASHVVVTSFVFRDGRILYENLEKLDNAVGREHLVLDLSARKKDGEYYVVTDRWQHFTEEKVTPELLHRLSGYCDEFLIHGVDVEGRGQGADRELVQILHQCPDRPVTYAGGISDYDDIEMIREIGEGNIDITIGSALDLFGGPLSFDRVLSMCREEDRT